MSHVCVLKKAWVLFAVGILGLGLGLGLFKAWRRMNGYEDVRY